MRVLCIGDVVGQPGRRIIRKLLSDLKQRERVDLVIANSENAAGGVGLTSETAKELLADDIDVLTNGNHIWKYREVFPLLGSEPRILRPMNYPQGTPGRGYGVFTTKDGQKVGVVNLLGRIFMEPVECPFAAASLATQELLKETKIILVEFHAEATSEKRAMGWFLDGQVSAVYGTHTHVPTADEEILQQGTGYITDIGMTGPYQSVIGMRCKETLQRFTTLLPVPFVVAKHDVRLCGVIFDFDPQTGKTRSVERVKEVVTS